jgi:membrane protease YdiL (CAAX protease family)
MMGLLYLKTRTLLIPIACHAFNNALAVGMAALPASESSNGLTLEQLRQSWWVGIVLLVISLPWLIRFIRKNYPRRDAPIPYLVNRSRH